MKKRLLYVLAFFLLVFHSSLAWSAELILVGDCRQASGNEDHALAEKIINDAIQYVKDNSDPTSDLQGIILTGDYVSKGKDQAGWEVETDLYLPSDSHLSGCVRNGVGLRRLGWDKRPKNWVPFSTQLTLISDR